MSALLPDREGPRNDPPRTLSGASLLHPVPLFALALLLLNDHVLKERDPGWLTGKLSDVAGMTFFPLFLVGLLEAVARIRRAPPPPRVWLMVCIAATACAFALVKTWSPATDAYAHAAGVLRWPFAALRAWLTGDAAPGVEPVAVVQDPTDLLALPFTLVGLLIRRPTRATSRGPVS